jgi:UDP:flavonoid glycosyltransferase YjiC (YdhE family)
VSSRIVFVTWGSFGDLHPYLALARELQRRGHRTAVATLSSFRPFVETAGVRFHPIRPDVDASDPAAFRDIVRRLLDPGDGPRFLFENVLNPVLRQTYDDTLAAVNADGGADLLVSHQVPLTTPVVAQKLGTKWVSGVLLPMAFLSAHDPATAPQAPWLYPVASLHPVLAAAFNRLGRHVTRPWVAPLYAFRQELGLPRGESPVFEGQHSPWLTLALFSRLFAPMQPDYPPQTLISGFAFYDAAAERPPSEELKRFMEAGDPPVVFTLGSSAVWIAGDFHHVSIEAVLKMNRRALILAGNEAARLRAIVPDSIAVVDYAPHSFVMPRASVVVHQGGVGTTGQALRSGRPMLVVPFGQDQPDNARRCARLGVARTIDRRRYTVDNLIAELEALSTAAYAANAERVGRAIDAERGTDTACDAIERVLTVPACRS